MGAPVTAARAGEAMLADSGERDIPRPIILVLLNRVFRGEDRFSTTVGQRQSQVPLLKRLLFHNSYLYAWRHVRVDYLE